MDCAESADAEITQHVNTRSLIISLASGLFELHSVKKSRVFSRVYSQ